MNLRNLPTRLAVGAFVLHSGIEKWSGDEGTAQALHGMASGTYPVLKDLKPTTFLSALSAGEMAVGAALLAPVVSPTVAGAALTGFSGGLMGLYWNTPGLRKPGTPWPTQDGLGVSKDVWMLGIGVGLLLDGLARGAKKSARHTAKKVLPSS
ncbi:hypothetical protein ASG49_01450 [Marmoricola sp. Leaf446]|uniref:hypothetical protein n=1 Tax=Marmoricola sp. Leaf446 TaxID=1736379 RepID=UPI0006F53213|nr:hypothetical protein [Marmoricola sp. Leaf446]KQT93685.1 hypothetical protein ASG49_01450 [Marmoricola sp. Leaf446]